MSVMLTASSVLVCRKTTRCFQKCHVMCENIGCLQVLQLTRITEPHCRFHVRKGADGPIDKSSHKQTNGHVGDILNRRRRHTGGGKHTFFIRPWVFLWLFIRGKRLHLQHFVDLSERHESESVLLNAQNTHT